jgi:hypothetical protein
MSVLGVCWVQAYFEKEIYFWRRPIFGEGSILRKDLTIGKKDLMLERKQQVARKQHAEKEGKVACKRKNNVASRETSLTWIGFGFLIRIVTAISL